MDMEATLDRRMWTEALELAAWEAELDAQDAEERAEAYHAPARDQAAP